MSKISLFVFFSFFFFKIGFSQNKGFSLQFSTAAVFSQVDGDSYDGYNKLGESISLSSIYRIDENKTFSIGIRYIQKGSKFVDTKYYSAYYLLRLHYAEVPVLFHYYWQKKYILTIGLSYAYLFVAGEDNDGYGLRDPYPALNKNEISYSAGLGYKINKTWDIFTLFSYSITPIRPFPGGQTYWFNRGLYNNYITIGLNYNLQ
jgi:hypothetical protein